MNTRVGDLVFAAIADPTRRAILCQLQSQPSSVEALAARFPISRPAISKHLAALHRAGLVRRTEQGRSNLYQTETAPLETVKRWLDEFWGDRLVLLKRLTEGDS